MEAKKSKAHDESRGKLSYYKALNDIGNQIHSAGDMNEILINLRDQILSLFDADRITIYVVDSKTKEIYQRFRTGDMPKEIRLPINHKSISGYTASTAQITNITNVYDGHELSMINKDLIFDRSWDEKSKFLTKSMLTVPIYFKKYLIGVLQLINKKNGDKFTLEDQNSAVEIAKVLGIAIFNQKKFSQKTKKRTKFDYLINNSIITQKELGNAIAIARDRKVSIESVFIEDMKVKKVEVGRSLGEFYNCEYVPYDSNYPIPNDLLAKLKRVYLKNNLWVPLGMEDGKVKILIDNPQVDDIPFFYLLVVPLNEVLLPHLQVQVNLTLLDDFLHHNGTLHHRLHRVSIPFLYDELGDGIIDTERCPLTIMEPDNRFLNTPWHKQYHQEQDYGST